MTPTPESLTPEQFEAFLNHLDTLLQNLPDAVPVGVPTASKFDSFLSFTLDVDLQEPAGCEIRAFNEQLKGIFGPTTGDGILPIDERGEPICAVISVLGRFHEKYPNDAIVKKWAVDIALGAEEIYRQHGIEPQSHAATGRPSVLVHTTSITAKSIIPDEVRMEDVDPTTKKRRLSWACVGTARKGTPQEPRVLEAIATSKDISLGAQIHETESANSDFETSETKRVKTQATLDPTQFQEAEKEQQDEEQQRFQAMVDHAIMRLIYVHGLDPTIVDSDEWKEMVTTLNLSYHPTPPSTFTELWAMCTDGDIDFDSPDLLDILTTRAVAGTTQPNATSTCVEKPLRADGGAPDWDW